MSFDDVVGPARIFAASCRFQAVATSLEKLANGVNLSTEEMQQLRWAGGLLARMDMNSPYRGKHERDIILGTQLAPHFYRTLYAITPEGDPLRSNMRDVLNRTYGLLTAPEQKNPLNAAELLHAQKLFLGLYERTLDEYRDDQRSGMSCDD